jgi:hypothetical protein
LNSSNVPVINETDYYFQGTNVFLNLTFSNVNSTSDILVAMPFVVENASQPYGFGNSMLNYGWKFAFHPPFRLGQNYWVENASFTNNYAYPNMILKGSLTMELFLDHDIFNVGPWQKSVLLSIGSNTSPLYAACHARACLSAYSGGSHRINAATFVEISFNQNEIIGDGTFPTPSLVASNNYTRGVAWVLPSSEYYHDLQLFLVANNFVWAFPLPVVVQPAMMTFGFVILQACFTKIFVDLTKKPKTRKDNAHPMTPCPAAEFI